MIPNPILKVLSTLTTRRVRFLLMGGQACVLYGAAQFSRDTDIAIAIDSANLTTLTQALDDLQAKHIAVPPFEVDYLRRGLAVHFRCQHPDAKGMRIDVMHVMRGVALFDALWNRRTTLDFEGILQIDLLALPDLVKAKKTQRDKDWPMIRLLVESHHKQYGAAPNDDQVRFWLREARTPSILEALANKFPTFLSEVSLDRPLLGRIAGATLVAIELELQQEEKLEREADRLYWKPLKKELEQLRHRT